MKILKKFLFVLMTIVISITSFSATNNKILKEFRGKPTYVKVWASWCPICLNTLDHTLDLYEYNKDNGNKYNITTVVFPDYNGEMSEVNFKKWWKGLNGINQTPVILDKKASISKEFGVRGYPFNIFLDSKGNVVYRMYGPLTRQQVIGILQRIK